MGCFDLIHGLCPSCGEKFDIQTKLFDMSSLTDYHVGDRLETAFTITNDIQLKDNCPKCDKSVIMRVEGSVITDFLSQSCKDVLVEGAYGSLTKRDQRDV